MYRYASEMNFSEIEQGIQKVAAGKLSMFDWVLAGGIGTIAVTAIMHALAARRLAKAKNPLSTEKQLMKRIEKSKWSKAHHYLIYHGRRVCTARSPKCSECAIASECEYKNKT